MIDLNWKIIMFATIDKARYQPQIDELITKLYEYETPQGGWPYPFDKKAKTADFVSYNAVLAAAMAGRRPETDEHLALAVKAMMAAQRQEGSWEGDPVYQGFNTPFRATQFAVMALSTLTPEPRKQRTGTPASPPADQAGEERSAIATVTVRPILGPGGGAGAEADPRSPVKSDTTGTGSRGARDRTHGRRRLHARADASAG